MKAWQLGYELDTLIEWTNKFEDYNKFCYSPFSKAKKNGMATALHKGQLHEQQGVVYEIRTAKAKSKIKMFGAGPEIAEVLQGEKVISKISYADGNTGENITNILNVFEEPIWCHIFEEDKILKDSVINSGFKKIGTKVSTFSDIVGVYYKGEREFTPVPQTENINILKKRNNKKVYDRKKNVVGKDIIFPRPYRSNITIKNKFDKNFLINSKKIIKKVNDKL